MLVKTGNALNFSERAKVKLSYDSVISSNCETHFGMQSYASTKDKCHQLKKVQNLWIVSLAEETSQNSRAISMAHFTLTFTRLPVVYWKQRE